MVTSIDINPQILAWARETAGLSVEEAAAKLGLKDTAKASAGDKLRSLEDGSKPIPATTLQKASDAYRRPLIAFYLPTPPTRGERGEDFRTLAGRSGRRAEAMLDALLRDVRARQQMVRDYLIDDEEAAPLPFVASARITSPPALIAEGIREVLGVDLFTQRKASNPAALFAHLRAAAERAGVFVLLLGDLGSHQSDIGEDVFRGFALADKIAPFVIINDNDAEAARSFSLMHELAHIWIGESGVSGPLRDVSTNEIERFCNAVAEEFLLPASAVAGVEAQSRVADLPQLLAITDQVAKDWNVSQSVVTMRLLRTGWITPDAAGQLLGYFSARWREHRLRVRETRRPEEGGPGYYLLRRSRLGPALLDVVRRGLQTDALTHTKAAKILGVRPTSVSRLVSSERPAS